MNIALKVLFVALLCSVLSGAHLPYERIKFIADAGTANASQKYEQLPARWLDGALRYSLSPPVYASVDQLLQTVLNPQDKIRALAAYIPESSPLHTIIAVLISGSLLLNTTGAFVLRTAIILMRRRDSTRL